MTDSAVLGPLGERDLAEQDGFDPANGLPFASRQPGFSACQYRFHDRQLCKAFYKIAGPLHGEPGTDLAGVPQRAVLPVAKIESPQSPLALARAAESQNNEFLPLRTFGFQPALLAAWHVGRLHLLGDNSFQTRAAGFCEHLLALPDNMVAVAKRRILPRFFQQSLQFFLALGQRQPGEILAVQMK